MGKMCGRIPQPHTSFEWTFVALVGHLVSQQVQRLTSFPNGEISPLLEDNRPKRLVLMKASTNARPVPTAL